MKIFDCFLFFNELDLLEIRFNLLNEYVDYFVIVESNLTFSGNPKPLYFEENRHRFSSYNDKIIHRVISDNPFDFTNLRPIENPANEHEATKNRIFEFIKTTRNFPKHEKHWGREFYQRECLHHCLLDCQPDDVIILSDLDEIPDPESLKNIQINGSTIYIFRQKMFYYYLNMFREDNWSGPKAGLYSTIQNESLNHVRSGHYSRPFNVVNVPNGGWHFTYMGGADRVRTKIQSWGHQELNVPQVINSIEHNIHTCMDPFFRYSNPLLKIDFSEPAYPKWLVENIYRYPWLLYTEL